jgi:CRISPR-associated protein Cmr4
MSEFRIGYLYSLAPIHPGGEGDLGNVLDIVREVHTNFPYIPGSSLRGCLRDEVNFSNPDFGKAIGDRLFGKELDTGTGTMGVHQAWFGDARLLWVPMRTMSLSGSEDAFTWVSCHSLVRDHALVSQKPLPSFPKQPIGNRKGTYWVADSQVKVEQIFSNEQKQAMELPVWAESLKREVKSVWDQNRIVLPDSDFEILMEHALWTQIRNKLTPENQSNGKTQAGSAEVFWTDICIPRDTILYFPWGYRKDKAVHEADHDVLKAVLQGLFQVGGQANVGRGWVQGWTANDQPPVNSIAKLTNQESKLNPELSEPVGA